MSCTNSSLCKSQFGLPSMTQWVLIVLVHWGHLWNDMDGLGASCVSHLWCSCWHVQFITSTFVLTCRACLPLCHPSSTLLSSSTPLPSFLQSELHVTAPSATVLSTCPPSTRFQWYTHSHCCGDIPRHCTRCFTHLLCSATYLARVGSPLVSNLPICTLTIFWLFLSLFPLSATIKHPHCILMQATHLLQMWIWKLQDLPASTSLQPPLKLEALGFVHSVCRIIGWLWRWCRSVGMPLSMLELCWLSIRSLSKCMHIILSLYHHLHFTFHDDQLC